MKYFTVKIVFSAENIDRTLRIFLDERNINYLKLVFGENFNIQEVKQE